MDSVKRLYTLHSRAMFESALHRSPAPLSTGLGCVLLVSAVVGSASALCAVPTALDLALVKQLVSDLGTNHAVSPFVMSTLMTQAWLAARGTTRSEISSVLGVTDDCFLGAYQSAIASLSSGTGTVNTKTFNGIYLAAGSSIKANFSSILSTYYSASVQHFSTPAAGAQAINSAVSAATSGLIPDLVSAGALTNAVFVLVSALYFKGDWLTEFNATLTQPGQFLTASGCKTATMMKLKTTVLYKDNGAYDVISLPYKDPNYSMLVFRPAAKTMASVQSLVNSLDSLDMASITGQLQNRTVIVTMPRFTISTNYDSLETTLQALGIQQLFTSADLGNMMDASLSVGKVIHKVKMEVTEQGTQAAGAGAMIGYGSPMPIDFTLDRPFVAVVWNSLHNINMFTAYVASP